MVFFLEYIFFRAIALLLNLIPYPVAMATARSFGICLYYILPSRRKITLDNLKAAYPGKSKEEIEDIAKGAFQNMALVAIEFVSIPRLVRKNFIRTVNTHHVWDALKGGKGLIFIVAHLTNWELMAVASSLAKFPMYAVARPVKNPFVYQYIKKLRGYAGLISIDKEGAIRETMKRLKQNNVVSFLIDQHERQGAAKVQFFGRPCYSTTLPARIAAKYGTPALLTYSYRDSNGVVTMDFEKPFQLINTGDEKKDAEANTQIFVNAIERRVREMPENWLWMHRRWRA